MTKLILILLVVVTVSSACDKAQVYPDIAYPEVLIKTSKGDILIELDRNRAPITVNNFLVYVKAGYYNKTIFHRVEKDFVIQGGGYNKDIKEIVDCGKIFNESGNGLRNTTGTIAMARYDDPHSATSQFYFNLTDTPSLDPNAKNWGYTVFGEVIQGMEVLKAIGEVATGYSNKLDSVTMPLEAVMINEISIQ